MLKFASVGLQGDGLFSKRLALKERGPEVSLLNLSKELDEVTCVCNLSIGGWGWGKQVPETH